MTGQSFVFAFARWQRLTPGPGGTRVTCLTCGRTVSGSLDVLAQASWYVSDDLPARHMCASCVPVVVEEFAA